MHPPWKFYLFAVPAVVLSVPAFPDPVVPDSADPCFVPALYFPGFGCSVVVIVVAAAEVNSKPMQDYAWFLNHQDYYVMHSYKLQYFLRSCLTATRNSQGYGKIFLICSFS